MKYWEVKAKKQGSKKVGELLFYGEISSCKLWGDEITPQQIDEELKALGEIDVLNIYISSPGGGVSAGQAIFSIIERHPAAEKYAYIDGLAASTASFLPMCCQTIYMAKNALMMVHKPMSFASGNADVLRQRADVLDKYEESMVNAYEKKTKQDRDVIKDQMAKETWMTADEALEFGYVDEIVGESKVAACLDGDFLVVGGDRVDVKDFMNFDSIKSKVVMYREDPKKDPEPVADTELQNQTIEFQKLRKKILGGN